MGNDPPSPPASFNFQLPEKKKNKIYIYIYIYIYIESHSLFISYMETSVLATKSID
jgi:hypothetical protein